MDEHGVLTPYEIAQLASKYSDVRQADGIEFWIARQDVKALIRHIRTVQPLEEGGVLAAEAAKLQTRIDRVNQFFEARNAH